MEIDSTRYLSVYQAANRLNVSKSTLWRWASDRSDFPKPVKMGKGITRWLVSEIEAFEAALKAPS